MCVVATEEFLAFSRAAGNDLSTARPEFRFPGLRPGDRWCVCASRWREAWQAGKAPPVVLTATHEASLDFVPLSELVKFAWKEGAEGRTPAPEGAGPSGPGANAG